MTPADPAAGPKPKVRTKRPAVASAAEPGADRLADLGLMLGFLGLVFLLGAFPHKDFDLWFHLKAGDMIRASGLVPRVDTLTYGAEDRPWIDLHWIFQVLVSLGYERGGVPLLNLAKCAISTVAVALLITSKRRDWPAWGILLAWLPALLVLSGRMYVRPETLTLLYLSIDLAILFRWRERPWLALGLPLVQLAWVNTQGLFALGPIIIGFALVDAGVRADAFAPDRRGWWRIALAASVAAGLACLANPFGLTGALYPLQLLGTMGDPIFKRTIGELKPIPDFIAESGFTSLPLLLHLATIALGALSFLAPLLWLGWARVRDRAAPPPADPKTKKKPKRATRPEAPWRLSPFRLLLFGSFSALSLAATRNSHQFAAVVGTVTAWNVGEWLAAIRARRLRLAPAAAPRRATGPRLVALGAIALAIAAVASGRFYAWSGENRTIGLGEEPLWFPHEAVRVAGLPGMPDRLVGYHNGLPALYEHAHAPARKAYTDARLEVMGAPLYARYLDLGRKIRTNSGGWAEELDAMGRPALLIDTVDPGNADLVATLMTARNYRCVYFDPIACVFVHASLRSAVEGYGVDFLARHYGRTLDASTDDQATLAATARAYRNVASMILARGGSDRDAAPFVLLGLDFARKLRQAADPAPFDGWKQAGLIENLRYPLAGDRPIPRFRLPFDPTFDLSAARATHDLGRALAIRPDDGYALTTLARLDDARGMAEAALAAYRAFAALPAVNPSQRQALKLANDRIEGIGRDLATPPKTTWDNLSELDRVVDALLLAGRAETAAAVIEKAHRAEARPWSWADRLAVLRLHLGQPEAARLAWIKAVGPGLPEAVRAARVAATYLVEADFEAARKAYREASALDPKLFEAQYGLALVEQDSGHAAEARDAATEAVRLAPNEPDRSAARLILDLASPSNPG